MRVYSLLLGALLLAAPAVSMRHRWTTTSLRQAIFQLDRPQSVDAAFDELPLKTGMQSASADDQAAFEDLMEQTSPAKLFSVPPGRPVKTMRQEDDSTVVTLSNLPSYALRFKKSHLCDSSVKQYSGYLDVGKDKHFFFWFFESRQSPDADPVMMWLNGGPGCSSMLGLFMELGPCMINSDGNGTRVNPSSWNNRANVIFLDQPVNVGYSYGTGTSTSDEAAKDVYAFMQLFYEVFPQFAPNDFHVFGESYGGHYVPAIGDEIRRQNQGALKDGYHPIPLKSIGVGNGLTDPLVQYKYYSKMACRNSYKPVLSDRECRDMDSAYPNCARLINYCYGGSMSFMCLAASTFCNKRMLEPYMRTGYNPYDVRMKCPPNSPLCYSEIESIQKYLNLPHVQKELGAKVTKYQGCDPGTYQRFAMSGDWMRPYVRKVPKILDAGIRVLIYAGDADFICNWIGNKQWTVELEWFGKSRFAGAKDKSWVVDGKQAGEVRNSGPLTFLRVFAAGHMVPYDQPTNSLDMINRWLSGKSYSA